MSKSLLSAFLAKNKNHIDQAVALINAAKKAGKKGEAFVTIAHSAIEDPYFQTNHAPGKYEGMGEKRIRLLVVSW